MELQYSGQIYVSIYYIILCLPKILCGKLTDVQKLEYCKQLQCDETVNEKVCGIRKENGINTYRIFDNECLLLKFGCQVNTVEAYGVINMKHCDENTSQESDRTTCQINCVSHIKEPVCGIRKDGEGFRIKMFSNICQLSKYNCEKQLQFFITDSFLCNIHKSTIQRRNTDEKINSEISEGFNDSNDTFDKKIRVMEKSDKSARETNNTEWEIENTNTIETSTLETTNLETSLEEISTVEKINKETHTFDEGIREMEKSEKSAGETNNTEWEMENTNSIEPSTLETINLETKFNEISTVEKNNKETQSFDDEIREMEKSEKSARETNNTEWEMENTNSIETSTLETINLETNFDEISTVENDIETHTVQRNSTEVYYEDTNTTNETNVGIETPTTIVNQEQNKTILRNIVVVRGSPSDIQNINSSVADFFAATHVFDLPVREMEPNITENTRRRLVKIFGPIRVFKPWLTKPDVIKEDRNHTPTLSSCFHKCPTKCPDTYAPVCGTPGIVAREPSLMFQNHCYMDVAQCKMFWEDNSPTAHSSAYIEASFLFCLGDELTGLYRFLPLVRTLQHMGRLKSKGKFRYRLKNMRFFNNLLDKQPHLMG